MRTVINQKEYAYGDIRVYVFGQFVAGLRGIEYKPTKTRITSAGRDTTRGVSSTANAATKGRSPFCRASSMH